MKLYIKHIIRSIWLGIAIFVVQLLLSFAMGRTDWSLPELLSSLAYTMGYTLTIYLANMWVFMTLDRMFERDRFTRKRLFVGFAASFVVSLACIFFLRLTEDVLIEGESIGDFIRSEKPANYIFASVVTLFVTLGIHAFYFYRSMQEARVNEQRVIAGNASAQFESLKNQIDPHFLFNSLNVLSSLIEENPDSAQKFTASLSKIYRYVLEQKDKPLVSLQEELDFAAIYLDLLKMRFENSLVVTLPSGPIGEECRVVPLSLQLLLENAIKHNMATEKNPLHIRIAVEDDCLVVENNLQRKETLDSRKGVGLQNIADRYAIVTDRKVVVVENEKHYQTKLPILTQMIDFMEPTTNDEQLKYQKAQKKVEDIKGFYGNLGAYILVIIFLVVVNLMTSPEHLWFIYPALGWGIGILFHGLSVFNYMPFLGSNWEEKKIREILDRDRTTKWK